jgi:NAD(P)-dependent dehydrogenase (short-subunit alcohol dehydrogenase family)
MTIADLLDTALEVPIAPSFTRIGYTVRSHAEHWPAIESYDLTGRVVLVTGATSGLGLATVRLLSRAGATVIVHGRDHDKVAGVRAELGAHGRSRRVHAVVADLADLASVEEAAAALRSRYPRLDAVIHNAGAMHECRVTTKDGIESTVAVHVVAPFLLTCRLLDRLRAARPGRVLTMSSGGMYAAGLTVDGLEMSSAAYRPTTQYAIAKRAQVTLNEIWASLIDPRDVVFHAAHPGWAATPGVSQSLPRFARLVGPLLRSPQQGADTIAWLAADGGPPRSTTGGFWHDRRPRPIHRVSRTRRSDTPAARRELWEWCVARSGADPKVSP